MDYAIYAAVLIVVVLLLLKQVYNRFTEKVDTPKIDAYFDGGEWKFQHRED